MFHAAIFSTQSERRHLCPMEDSSKLKLAGKVESVAFANMTFALWLAWQVTAAEKSGHNRLSASVDLVSH